MAAAVGARSVLPFCRAPVQSTSSFRMPLKSLVLGAVPPASASPPRSTLALTDRRSLSSSASTGGSHPRGKFTYSVAASYIAKDHPYDPLTHVFHFNPYNRLQHTSKARPESGQDAFFVSRVGDTGGVALGVADGVGGWMDSGVDPADFSHGLCEVTAAAAYEHRAGAGVEAGVGTGAPVDNAPRLTARQLMQTGYEAVCRDPAIPAGGSTAVVALLGEDGEMEVANLGDSGFVQLRLNAVHAASEPQTHAFNTPFQLSVVPPNVLARMAAFGGAQLSDLPRDAEVTRHALRAGDVLVFASDGVWDNLFNQDILRIVSRTMTGAGAWATTPEGLRVAPDLTTLTTRPGSPATLQSLLATEITAAAKAASVNQKLDGPFAKEVKKYYPHETWHGGKVDDICVVVVVVEEAQTAQPLKSRL